MATGHTNEGPISATAVAGLVLLAAKERGISSMPHRKLQKLLYLVQLYHIGLHHQQAFGDRLKAWEDGPVSTEVWTKFKHLGGFNISVEDHSEIEAAKTAMASNPTIYDSVVKVVEDFGRLSQRELVELTHGQPPWLSAWKGDPKSSEPIESAQLTAFAPILIRAMGRDPGYHERQSAVAAFFSPTNDASAARQKLKIADAAGELDSALAIGSSDSRIAWARNELAEAISASSAHKEMDSVLTVDPADEGALDEFARMLTSFAMAHR